MYNIHSPRIHKCLKVVRAVQVSLNSLQPLLLLVSPIVVACWLLISSLFECNKYTLAAKQTQMFKNSQDQDKCPLMCSSPFSRSTSCTTTCSMPTAWMQHYTLAKKTQMFKSSWTRAQAVALLVNILQTTCSTIAAASLISVGMQHYLLHTSLPMWPLVCHLS